MGVEVAKNSVGIHIAIMFSILMLISLVSLTTRVLLGAHAPLVDHPLNIIFDPDVRDNFSTVCPYNRLKYHKLQWRQTVCFNKTLLLIYNPWIRHWAWLNFKKDLARKIQTRNERMTNYTETIELIKEQIAVESDNKTMKSTEPIEPSNLVYVVLTLMVVLSTIITCFEVFRDKITIIKNQTTATTSDRRCSLADFTIKRHLRKESQDSLQRQGALEEEKVTHHGLFHQGSLDRAFSKIKPAVKVVRQHSVPSRLIRMDSKSLNTKNRQSSTDMSEDEAVLGSPQSHRKSRHFIRRH